MSECGAVRWTAQKKGEQSSGLSHITGGGERPAAIGTAPDFSSRSKDRRHRLRHELESRLQLEHHAKDHEPGRLAGSSA